GELLSACAVAPSIARYDRHMESKLLFGDPIAFALPALAVFAADRQTDKAGDPQPFLLTTSPAIEAAARALLASGEFKASLGEVAVLHAPAVVKAERLLVVGVGRGTDVLSDVLRKAAGTAVRAAKSRAVR